MSDLGVAVVIEDDADMRSLLEAVLAQAGFDVHTASDGRSGVEVVRENGAHVVTLDIGLPDIDGFEVLRRLREFSDTYVIMVTGRTAESYLLTALDAGADDYITKPFRPLELRARIGALMRRPRLLALGGRAPTFRPSIEPRAVTRDEPIIRHNGLTLNCQTRTANLGGAAVELTRSEFDLLHELLRSAGTVRSKAELVRVIRGNGGYPENAYISESDERSVEVHIANLRRKLRENTETPRWLETVRGLGYRLAPDRTPLDGNRRQ